MPSTGTSRLQVATDDAGNFRRAEFDYIFPDLGGAHQVIVPFKLKWVGDRFIVQKSKRSQSLSEVELIEKAQLYKPLFNGNTTDFVPPELAEELLRLMIENDFADANKLMHLCWPKGIKGEREAMEKLKDALIAKTQEFSSSSNTSK